MKKYLWLISIGLILLTAWLGRLVLMGKAIEVVHPEYGTAVEAAYATGTVEATVMLPISTHISARLIKLNVDEGSEVVKGQVLAQLEDEELQQTLVEQKEREDLARKRHERNAELVKRGVVSKDEYDRTLSELRTAEAAVHATEAQIKYLKLVAPANGHIIRRDGEIGQLIPANQAVFWLSCCAPLRISTEVDEEDIAEVHLGQKVLIRADAFPGRIFYGKVQSITPKGDPVARSYRVRIGFTEKTPLLIGMTAETNIIFHEKKNALLLPVTAVTDNKIWRVQNHRLVQSTVLVGAKGFKQVEILKGVNPQDLIVLLPDATLQEGDRVRPILVKQEKE
ncbi:efflux RND transporter periplasmic adaptor subunit [Legionella cardiaca]|uniref:Efflux RND transporter periplasmic adaptor subunit n=1 Tax=Legionella cardiaca TaxID=1071983 RepID=A0ABY8AT78_9GAMM|nr:efflux RND transporter periplasmic adaptor subunit [Legionella cardiaca]WED42991.1 efflux RND transporter periplasmic adaptor subunit [Legionella cardiaca]